MITPHRAELPLFDWAIRALSSDAGPVRRRFEDFARRMDAETELTLGPLVHSHSAVFRSALLVCRIVWAQFKLWDAEHLSQFTAEIEESLTQTPFDAAFTRQYIGLSIGDDWVRNDPLIDHTIIAVDEWSSNIRFSDDEISVIRSRINAPGRVSQCARRLLSG